MEKVFIIKYQFAITKLPINLITSHAFLGWICTCVNSCALQKMLCLCFYCLPRSQLKSKQTVPRQVVYIPQFSIHHIIFLVKNYFMQ